MVNKIRNGILMSYYKTQTTNNCNKVNNNLEKTTSFIVSESSTIDSSSISNNRQTVWSSHSMRANTPANQAFQSSNQTKFDAWAEEDRSDIKLYEESSSIKEQHNLFRRFQGNICSSTYSAYCIGLVIGLLCAGIALAVVLTVWLHKTSVTSSTISTNTPTITDSTTITTTTSITTVTTTTSITTVTTTTISTTTTTQTSSTTTTTITTSTTTTSAQSSIIAYSSLASYCGCSGFTLSIDTSTFNTNSATYLWQSSPTGQNIWTNVNTYSGTSSWSISSQATSTDYQCQVSVVYPTPVGLTSTIATVMTTTYTAYCTTILVDCTCCGDDLNDFILVGESGTQINDLSTGCASNSYDNRTQESVTLYENMNYTGQASSQYTGGGEQLAIWIDFNNNFQFESSEQVTYQPLNTVVDTDFIAVIPSSSQGGTIGIHRMRATVAYSAIPNACGTSSSYGETHDYTVNILSSAG